MGIIIKLPGITRKWPGIIIIFGGGHGNTLVYFGIMITNSAKLGIIKVISPFPESSPDTYAYAYKLTKDTYVSMKEYLVMYVPIYHM